MNKFKYINIVLLSMLIISCENTVTSDEEREGDDIIRVGAILDLSGEYGHTGIAVQSALEIRAEMINNLLDELYSSAEVKLYVEDGETDPELALQLLQEMAEDSITMVIGPMTSAALAYVTEFANENEIVLISPSATAPSLAVPDDYILRFCPNDLLQSRAISAFLWDDGKKYVIPVNRDDLYGNELADYVSLHFTELGGETEDKIIYQHDTADFSSLISSVSSAAETAKASFSLDEIAILLIGIDESADILAAALSDTELTTIDWYGSDANALSSAIQGNFQALEMANTVHFTASTFGREEATDVDDIIINEIKSRTGYEQVSMIPIYAYDALYTFFLAYTRVHENNGAKILREFPLMTRAFYGASGWVELDSNGDRIYGDYDFWSMEDGHWVKTARFEINRGEEEGTLIRIP